MNGNHRRGFGSFSSDKLRMVSSKAGKIAHQKGRAHEWTSEEARVAGKKGGRRSGLLNSK